MLYVSFSTNMYMYEMFVLSRKNNTQLEYTTVKSVYKGYSREPENVAFTSSCPLYTG